MIWGIKMNFNLKEIILIFLKGLFMGSADIVPGVSGGTIALITGIYERLIYAISPEMNITIKLWLAAIGFNPTNI